MTTRFDTRSLRFRIMLLAVATIGITLVVAAISVRILFEQHMERRIGQELETRFADIAGATIVQPDGHVALSRPLFDVRYQQPLGGAYWQIVEADQTTLRSRSLWDETLPSPPSSQRSEPFEAKVSGGGLLYALSRTLRVGPDDNRREITVSVALDHADIDALTDAFGTDLNWALVAIALSLGVGAFVQMNIGLAPLRRLRSALSQVRKGEALRLDGSFSSEVQPLVDDLNRLLDRQEALIHKARERAGSLAHGFKTPLTILALEAQKLEGHGEPAAARQLRDQIETMRCHVERELNRSRIRGGSTNAVGAGGGCRPAHETARLVELVQRMPRSENLTFEVDIDPTIAVRMDPNDFREVLGNLLDNARKFATTRVAVRARRKDQSDIDIEVVDDGPGFDATRAAPLADASSSMLGLSIVSDVLEAYGTSLAIGRNNGLTVIRLSLKARVLVASSWQSHASPLPKEGTRTPSTALVGATRRKRNAAGR